jgi:hypothetical protein
MRTRRPLHILGDATRSVTAASLAMLCAATLSAQAIAVMPQPSRPAPRPPCCLSSVYVDGLVTTGPLVSTPQVAGALAPTAPPPPRAESPGPLPGGGMAWVPGYWAWTGNEFVWDGGRWVPIPVGATTWVPGRWESRSDGYAWVPGRWK